MSNWSQGPTSASHRFVLSIVLFSLCLFIGLGLAPAPVHAQASLAVNHYRSAASYFKQGKYVDALREFKESYRLSKKADLLYNIGQVHERMGHLVEAIKTYETYLNLTKAAEPTLHEKLANLKATLESTAVSVSCSIPGASVTLDGKTVGTTPLANPVKVKPGSHQIRLTKPGYRAFSAYVAVSAGSSVTVTARLEGVPGAIAPAKAVAPKPKPSPAVMPAPIAPKPATATTTGGRSRTWTWVALGTGAALVAAGGITGAMAMGKAGDAQSDHDADADSAKSLALISDITLVGGLAALTTGAILFFMDGSPKSERVADTQPTLAIIPSIGPRSAGLGAIIRF